MSPSGLLLLFWIVCPYYVLMSHALPSISSFLSRNAAPQDFRDGTEEAMKAVPSDPTHKVSPLVSASAQIKDSNGVDITSGFQVKVYRPNSTLLETNNTGGDGLHNRQVFTAGTAMRLIDECYTNETFVESHCIPMEDYEAPLQGYAYTCKRVVDYWHANTGQYMGQRPAYWTRLGRCEPTELCVDGLGSLEVATCVHQSLFDDYTFDKKGQLKGMLDGEVFNVAKMYAVMAKFDKGVAIKARKLGIVVWDSSEGGEGESTQNKNCANCAGIETDPLQPGIDSFKIEAILMSAGAIAGSLFLALA